jgi:Nucleotidyl transferase AbiEii toxin, Type IV TA system
VTPSSVELVGEPVAQMVRAAARANGVRGLRLAIIGGLAVTCRLGHVHRATGDVDAVVDEVVGLAANSGAQLLVEAGIAEPDPGDRAHRVFIDGTKLEIIDTQAIPVDVSDIAAPLPRLFVLGHRWALESAESLRIVVAASDVDATLPVAVPAALVATKLHAFCDRQQDEKRASDAYDIYRLLETRDREGAIAEATNDGPLGLAEVVREVMADRFVDGAVRVVRYLKTYGDPGWPTIDADDIRRVVGSFTSRLRA